MNSTKNETEVTETMNNTIDIKNIPVTINFPFSYYNPKLFNECFQGQEEKKKTLEKEEEKSLKDRIETQVKNKYNLIIPAILIEVKDIAKGRIILDKEDLNKLLKSLGKIKHIEIQSSHAYVLYENYFSALIAFNILNDIIIKDNKNLLIVKLFTKEEDEAKQNKINNQNKIKKSILENIIIKRNSKEEGSITENNRNNIFINEVSFKKNEEGSNKINEDNQNLNFTLNSNYLGESFFSENNPRNDLSLIKLKEEKKDSSNIPKMAYNENQEVSYKNNIWNQNYSQSSNFNNNYNNKNFAEYDPKYLPWNHFKTENNNTRTQNNKNDFSDLPTFPDHFVPGNYSLLAPIVNPDLILHSVPYTVPSNLLYSNMGTVKYVCNYDIQIENEVSFKVTKRLIGNKGMILKKILYDSCLKYGDPTTKIRLRGKGSGYKEGDKLTESEDPMQLCVSSLNYFSYLRCCNSVQDFLNQIYLDYFNFLFLNKHEANFPKKIVRYEYVVNRAESF